MSEDQLLWHYLEVLFSASQVSSKTYGIGVCILLNAKITHMHTQSGSSVFYDHFPERFFSPSLGKYGASLFNLKTAALYVKRKHEQNY